jgi:hypothetical protein
MKRSVMAQSVRSIALIAASHKAQPAPGLIVDVQ